MIESAAYFESYKHVLRQLQEMDTWPQIPMQQYFVHGKAADGGLKQPEYLAQMMLERGPEVQQMI